MWYAVHFVARNNIVDIQKKNFVWSSIWLFGIMEIELPYTFWSAKKVNTDLLIGNVMCRSGGNHWDI